MESNHDKVFVTTFLGVIGFLVALTIGIVIVANIVTAGEESEELRQIAYDRVQSRITPVGEVITDPNAIKVSAAEDSGEPRSGEEIVQGLCSGCHAAGVAGAPKLSDTAEWQSRLDADGREGMISAVINGKGAMPPKAGDPSLSEAEIEQALDVMLKQAGV